MIKKNKVTKYILPDGHQLIIHAYVVNILLNHIQSKNIDYESGGFLVGYENRKTDSIIIEDITFPKKGDHKSRISFVLKDKEHFHLLEKAKKYGSFFLGTWHTHPQDFVAPSFIDWIDWKKSVNKEQSASRYMIFMIVGRKEIGIWCGTMLANPKKILKIEGKRIEQM